MAEATKLTYLDIPLNRAMFHYERAIKLLNEGNNYSLELERIIKELNRASSLKPNDPVHFIAKAEVYKRALDTSSAIFALRFALDRDPTDLKTRKQLCDLLVNRAQEMMRLGTNYERASCYFEDALDMDPTRDNVWVLKAVCDVHCKKFKSALQAVNRAINIGDITTIDIFILRAKIHWAMGNVEIGNKDMRKAVLIDGEHPESKAFIARAYANAEKMYMQSLDLFNAGQFDEAKTHIQHALEVNQNDVKLHMMLSKCYRAKGDLNNAYSALTAAAEVFKRTDPYGTLPIVKVPFEITRQQNLVINEMAMKLAIEGQYQKAIVLMNKAIASERKLQPNEMDIDYCYFKNRGDCYRAINEPLFAIADYKLALARAPGNWSITTNLSITYYDLAVENFNDAKYASCKEQLDGALALNNKISEYYSLRGKAEYYLGMYHEAYEDFKEALRLNPEDKEVQMRLRQFEKDAEQEASLDQQFESQCRITSNTATSMRKRGPPMKVKIQPSAINISDDPLGLTEDLCEKVSREDLAAPLEVSFCTSLLPTLNPNMAAPMIAHTLAKKRRQELKSVTHSRTNLQKSGLWNMVQVVEEGSSRLRQPVKKAIVDETRKLNKSREKKVAMSAVALKRMSEEISKQAAKKPLIGGVVTSHNDPMLLAEQEKLNKKKVKKAPLRSRVLVSKSSSLTYLESPQSIIDMKSSNVAKDAKL
eukprot:CAMPEP_0185029960 /NCGR_PEP_ID=MMETSP1103-20130426/16622_1 /TAXON_ID=36769 /ORGANISM="Paraphysomonas bandaiensis, Strain Caron Lab Isolate" /LENGTH=704 /DNA_ID=CAMNT_0027564901 /DNA_START=160 /DNA_END=2271 /DNA_ORIENTATION=-